MEMISAKELKRYAMEGNHWIIDLRSREDYLHSHVRGAVNVPQGKFERELPAKKGAEIILYCERGGLSMTVGRELEKSGYSVKSVVGGYRACQKISSDN